MVLNQDLNLRSTSPSLSADGGDGETLGEWYESKRMEPALADKNWMECAVIQDFYQEKKNEWICRNFSY